jgi:glucose/arabinose dehydrogenase
MKNRSCTLVVALAIFIVAQACASQSTRTPFVFWTATPSPSNATQTPVLVEITKVVQITVTPQPTAKPTMTRQIKLCVTAIEAVHLRPAPNDDNYPITTLTNGVEVVDKGGRDGEWTFVEVGDKQGWVYAEYIKPCQ